MQTPAGAKHYYVDEAGDLTLFNASGAVIVGNNGVSNTFIVGVAVLPDPSAARAALEALRSQLLADPYFRGVPSMSPSAGKTAVFFHAKDDLPEVRREVFKLLPTLGVKVQAVIRRKAALVAEARAVYAIGGRLRDGDIYDGLVSRLFKNRLHVGESHEVCFARRGKSDRQDALTSALQRARRNFKAQWKSDADPPFSVRSSVPSAEAGLQIIDYYLWALQRLMERNEDRYFATVADQFSLVMDIDDTRKAGYGRWYTSRDPLTLEKKQPLTS